MKIFLILLKFLNTKFKLRFKMRRGKSQIRERGSNKEDRVPLKRERSLRPASSSRMSNAEAPKMNISVKKITANFLLGVC